MSSLAQGDDGRHGLVAVLQVTALAIQLFSAGLDNAAYEIGNAVIGLLAEPWQTELLRHRPALLHRAPRRAVPSRRGGPAHRPHGGTGGGRPG